MSSELKLPERDVQSNCWEQRIYQHPTKSESLSSEESDYVREEERGETETYNIAECNNVKKSGRSSGIGGGVGFIDVFVGEKRRCLAHRIGELRQVLDRRHRWIGRSANQKRRILAEESKEHALAV